MKFVLIIAIIALLVVACFMRNTAVAVPINFMELLGRPRAVPTHKLAYGTQPDQFGELWLPEGKGPHPVVVMLHGGCWQAALPGVELMAGLAEDLRESGFAVWNVEYRRLGTQGAGYPGTFEDVANGVDYLRDIAATYHLNLGKVTAIGHSAGGHLALWAAARSRLPMRSPLHRADPLPVASVITLAGINDLAAYRATGPAACGGPTTIDRLINAERDNPYADTSPPELLPLGVKQLIVSGVWDEIVPARFGADYATRAMASGDTVEQMAIEQTGHFELIDPQSQAWAVIKSKLQR